MDYSKYYEARKIIKEILNKDLLGPLSSDEILDDYPIVYYVAGKLYPQDCRFAIERTNAEDIGSIEEAEIPADEGFVPSSMGLSFAVSQKAKTIELNATAAKYIPINNPNAEDKRFLWKRIQFDLAETEIKLDDLYEKKRMEFDVDDGLKIMAFLHKSLTGGNRIITVSMVNTNKQGLRETRSWVNQHTYFQPKIVVSAGLGSFVEIHQREQIKKQSEALEMEMLYSDYRNYSVGHGCATDFHENNGQMLLMTECLPEYELKQMMPTQNDSLEFLSMSYLAKSDRKSIIYDLLEWMEDYKCWIDKKILAIEDMDKEFRDTAKDNLRRCLDTYDTIRESIKELEKEDVFKAFKYANEAMLLQRKHTLQIKGAEVNNKRIMWYPFQLAFFMKEIKSFADPCCKERESVDLLWFPTGGGKTEAYLGIAAFVIFLRRLRNQEHGEGVSVIMRYTLRLLTFQQFERASALICACEVIRKKYNIPGGEISIGLWAGKAMTPNSIDKAKKILDGYPDPENESSNPRQLERCPWCGRTLQREDYVCSETDKRMYIRCGNKSCDFHDALPVYLIDEEIYKYRPSFLIATIDKFAQVSQREQTFSLFGKGCNVLPPELIIQDELHLISGPLGTITGIYEVAFQKMCKHDEIKAKVIASTATIKNAREQISSLYGEEYTQFPPQGLSADDSYFAIKSTEMEKPSRLYMGCMGTGMSATSVMVRVMAATLYATRYLEMMDYDEEIIDSFWTITSYFNTLRELGGAIIRVVDNVQDRFSYLKETKFKKLYPIVGGQLRYDHYKELTSREKSENIGKIIQKELVIKYARDKKDMPYDFILSSNMISVGIDIARLNTMLVVGQPKTTAEYIQATSRVGRETPGFVFALYNQMRSRDKSHFEQFVQYHQAFYRYVEATSVTPFAERARDRALQTLYIMLCRFYIDKLSANEAAGNYRRDLAGLEDLRSYILDYVKNVDPDEYENVELEIEDIEMEWEALALKNPKMTYRKDPFQKIPALFSEDYEEESRFRVLNSMRSVETTIQVIARE